MTLSCHPWGIDWDIRNQSMLRRLTTKRLTAMKNLLVSTTQSTLDPNGIPVCGQVSPGIDILAAELSGMLAEGVIIESNLPLPTAHGRVNIDLFLMGIGGGVAISIQRGAFRAVDATDFATHPTRLVHSFYEIGALDVAYHLDAIIEVLLIRHPELFARVGATTTTVRLRRSGEMLHRYELVATVDEAPPLLMSLTQDSNRGRARAA